MTELATRPMRAARPVDLEGVYANPRAVLAKRTAAGRAHKVARGVFVAVPDDAYDAKRWRPALEAAGGAVGTALLGDRKVVAIGMTAARLLRVVPRAHATVQLAAATRHRDVVLIDRPAGRVQFVCRDLAKLRTQPVKTDLGTMLVTTPEQTLVDLAAAKDATTHDTREAMRALAAQVDWTTVERIAQDQYGARKALPALRALKAA